MSDGYRIRVMIVDDHPMVRDGLKVFLLVSQDMELVGEASSGEEALTLCAAARPDIVLMDLKMPGMDGIAATRAIRKCCPQTEIIALTSFSDEGLVQQAMQAGAIGYLLKDVSAEALAEAIRELVKDPEKRSEMGHKGREYVREFYSRDKLAREYAAILKDQVHHEGAN